LWSGQQIYDSLITAVRGIKQKAEESLQAFGVLPAKALRAEAHVDARVRAVQGDG
jgi:hypothetical protein